MEGALRVRTAHRGAFGFRAFTLGLAADESGNWQGKGLTVSKRLQKFASQPRLRLFQYRAHGRSKHYATLPSQRLRFSKSSVWSGRIFPLHSGAQRRSRTMRAHDAM